MKPTYSPRASDRPRLSAAAWPALGVLIDAHATGRFQPFQHPRRVVRLLPSSMMMSSRSRCVWARTDLALCGHGRGLVEAARDDRHARDRCRLLRRIERQHFGGAQATGRCLARCFFDLNGERQDLTLQPQRQQAAGEPSCRAAPPASRSSPYPRRSQMTSRRRRGRSDRRRGRNRSSASALGRIRRWGDRRGSRTRSSQASHAALMTCLQALRRR